jgi:hypothetical protein
MREASRMFRCQRREPPASRADLDRAHGDLLRAADRLEASITSLGESVSHSLRDHPVSVRLSPKQLDRVLARLNDPLVFPREITRHIAEDIAQHGNQFCTWQMSYHPAGFTAECEFRADGTLRMSFTDASGQRFWAGVFHGVDG